MKNLKYTIIRNIVYKIKKLYIIFSIWIDIIKKWKIYIIHRFWLDGQLPKQFFYEKYKGNNEYKQVAYNNEFKYLVNEYEYMYGGNYEKYVSTPYRYFQKFSNKSANLFVGVKSRNGFGPVNNDLKLKIIEIKNSVYYEGITFCNVSFENVNLEDVCFHNCRFIDCDFINLKSKESWYMDYKQGFSACEFINTNFNNCQINNIFFSMGKLNMVKFIDCNIYNTLFHRLSFSNVIFSGKIILCNTAISKPNRLFDIYFKRDDILHMDCGCFFTDVDAKDCINYSLDEIIENKKKYKKKSDYARAANTFFQLEHLISASGVKSMDEIYVNAYYNRKKAVTRSDDNILKSAKGYLSEYTNGYGERPFLCIAWMIALIVIFGGIYLFSGFKIGECDIIQYHIGQKISLKELGFEFLQSIYFSYFTLISVGQGDIVPVGKLSHFAMSIELGLGVIFIALFTATLFRKITR